VALLAHVVWDGGGVQGPELRVPPM
jgi:hypothetical protein